MPLGNAAHAMGRKELALVEKARQHFDQHGWRHQRQQMLSAFISAYRAGTDDASIEHAILMSPEQIVKTRAPRQQSCIHNLAGKEVYDANPGKNIDTMCGSVRFDHEILEKTVYIVPQRYMRPGVSGYGVGDCQELAVALDRDVFIGFIFNGDFQRHHSKLQGEHGHPTSRVGLLQRIAGWQWTGTVIH